MTFAETEKTELKQKFTDSLSKEDFFYGHFKACKQWLAKLCRKSVITVKRHIAKLSHIKYAGSGYSGHWEIEEK